MFSTQSLVYAWENQHHYAIRLTEDVTEAQMVYRPGGNMNHPAWILGHISLYHPIIPALLRGEVFADPGEDRRFGFRGDGPMDDLAAYASKADQLARFSAGHEQVSEALLNATPDQLLRRPSLPRWAADYPTVEFMLPDLLLYHESLHIGQLSIWRRAAGLPAVEIPDRTPRPALLQRYPPSAGHSSDK